MSTAGRIAEDAIRGFVDELHQQGLFELLDPAVKGSIVADCKDAVIVEIEARGEDSPIQQAANLLERIGGFNEETADERALITQVATAYALVGIGLELSELSSLLREKFTRDEDVPF